MTNTTSYGEILDNQTILDLKYYSRELYDACLLRYYTSETDEFNKEYYMKKVVAAANKIVQLMEENNETN